MPDQPDVIVRLTATQLGALADHLAEHTDEDGLRARGHGFVTGLTAALGAALPMPTAVDRDTIADEIRDVYGITPHTGGFAHRAADAVMVLLGADTAERLATIARLAETITGLTASPGPRATRLATTIRRIALREITPAMAPVTPPATDASPDAIAETIARALIQDPTDVGDPLMTAADVMGALRTAGYVIRQRTDADA